LVGQGSTTGFTNNPFKLRDCRFWNARNDSEMKEGRVCQRNLLRIRLNSMLVNETALRKMGEKNPMKNS
jgi:hypothetical protein